MWYKILFYILIVVLIFSLQVSLLGSLGVYAGGIDLMLATLVLLVLLAGFDKALIFVFAGGLLMDIYSSLPFGIFLLSYFITAVVLEFLFFNFFTNRSFYSLMSLGLIAVLVRNIVFLLSSGVAYFFNFSNFFVTGEYWLSIVAQFVGMVLIMTVLFYVINLSSRKFKPHFISQ